MHLCGLQQGTDVGPAPLCTRQNSRVVAERHRGLGSPVLQSRSLLVREHRAPGPSPQRVSAGYHNVPAPCLAPTSSLRRVAGWHRAQAPLAGPVTCRQGVPQGNPPGMETAMPEVSLDGRVSPMSQRMDPLQDQRIAFAVPLDLDSVPGGAFSGAPPDFLTLGGVKTGLPPCVHVGVGPSYMGLWWRSSSSSCAAVPCNALL